MEKNRRGISYITEPQRHWQSNKQNKKVELKSKCLRRRDLKMLDQQRAQGAGNYVRGARHQVQEAGSRHQTQEVGPPEQGVGTVIISQLLLVECTTPCAKIRKVF